MAHLAHPVLSEDLMINITYISSNNEKLSGVLTFIFYGGSLSGSSLGSGSLSSSSLSSSSLGSGSLSAVALSAAALSAASSLACQESWAFAMANRPLLDAPGDPDARLLLLPKTWL
jgi:hypothetical protein